MLRFVICALACCVAFLCVVLRLSCSVARYALLFRFVFVWFYFLYCGAFCVPLLFRVVLVLIVCDMCCSFFSAVFYVVACFVFCLCFVLY